MLVISAASALVGYMILDANGFFKRRPAPKKMARVVPQQPVAQPREDFAPAVQPPRTAETSNEEIAPPIIEKPHFQSIVQLPDSVELPPRDSFDVVELLTVRDDTVFSVLSLDNRLELLGKSLLMKSVDEESQRIAGITIRDNKLVFRWLPEAEDDGVSAVRNGLIRIDHPTGTSFVALRKPKTVKRNSLEFKKPVTRILCECDDPPPPEKVVLSLVADSTLPEFTTSGSRLSSMRQGDECIMWYKYDIRDDNVVYEQLLRRIGPDLYIREVIDFGLGTKVILRKRGNLLSAELYSRYRLPSGDEGSLTLSNGRKKRKKIESLVESSISAGRAIGRLRSTASRLQSDLAKWQSMATTRQINGIQIKMPNLVAEKQAGVSSTANALANVRANIAEAERLIENRPNYEIELVGLNRISRMAQKVVLSRGFDFRFFFILDGREVDLVVSAP